MARGKGCSPFALKSRTLGTYTSRFTLAGERMLADLGSETHRTMLEDYARARTKHPTTVKFGESGSYTDMNGNIVIDATEPADGPDGHRYLAMRGLLTHEILHEQHTSRSVWEEFKEGMQSDIEEGRRELGAARREFRDIPDSEQIAQLTDVVRRGPAQLENIRRVMRPRVEAELANLSARATKKRAELEAVLLALDAAEKDIEASLQTAPAELAALRAAHPELDDIERRMHAAANKVLLATQVKDSFNIAEDGRIEEYCRENAPHEYRRISLLNRVNPRVPETYTTPADGDAVLAPCPDGYIPVDAAGAELPTTVGPDGKTMVVLEPGTELPVWGDKPLDPKRQMRAALLAQSVPEFAAGTELHPDVRACLDECQPLLDEAIAGDTRQCMERARTITEVMDRRRMLPKSEDESATSGGEGQPGDGDGGQGGQAGQGGQPGGRGGTAGVGDILGDDWAERGDGGSQGEGASEASGGAGDGEDASGTDAKTREANDKGGKGSAGKDEADAEGDRVERDVNQRGKKAAADAAGAQSRGDIDGSAWNAPQGQEIVGQQTIVPDGDSGRAEFGSLRNTARRLAAEFDTLQSATKRPRRHQTKGKLDRRTLHKIPAAIHTARETGVNQTPRIFYHPGKAIDLDLSVEVLLDLSGSMNEHRSQLRDGAVATHLALEQLKVPHGIWGFDSSHGADARHYEFKSIARDGAQALGEIAARNNPRCAAGGGTPTDSAIEFSTTRLDKRGEDARLMFVFTDGMPNGSRDPLNDTRRRVEEAKKRGITVVGVLFNERHGSPWAGESSKGMREIFGSEFIEIDDIAEMPRQMGGLLRSLMGFRAGG